MRSEAFKKYVLSRAGIRMNPYNFSRIDNFRDYARGYGDESDIYEEEYGSSAWSYEDLLNCPLHIEVVVIVPAEVVHSKIWQGIVPMMYLYRNMLLQNLTCIHNDEPEDFQLQDWYRLWYTEDLRLHSTAVYSKLITAIFKDEL